MTDPHSLTQNLIFMNQPLPLPLCHPDAPGPALQGSPIFICISGPPFPERKITEGDPSFCCQWCLATQALRLSNGLDP